MVLWDLNLGRCGYGSRVKWLGTTDWERKRLRRLDGKWFQFNHQANHPSPSPLLPLLWLAATQRDTQRQLVAGSLKRWFDAIDDFHNRVRTAVASNCSIYLVEWFHVFVDRDLFRNTWAKSKLPSAVCWDAGSLRLVYRFWRLWHKRRQVDEVQHLKGSNNSQHLVDFRHPRKHGVHESSTRYPSLRVDI